jgi:hypothetical protein
MLRISSSSGRLFLGTFFGGAKKVPRAKRANPLKNGMNVPGAKYNNA